MKRYTKEQLYVMDAVDVYKMVLRGDEIKRFPRGFWQQPEARSNAIKCTKYLIEEVLRYDDEMLMMNYSKTIYTSNKLGGMLRECFNNTIYDCINAAYPGKFQPWEVGRASKGLWQDKQNGIDATKWLIETKLKLSNEQIKDQLSQKLFEENNLTGMLQACFDGSPYKAINATYPGMFQEWELKCVPEGFWKDKQNGIDATKWLIETKLKLSDEQIKEQLSVELFSNNGLRGMLQHCFDSSPYKAIDATYPGKFEESKFRPSVPLGFWKDKQNGIDATKWLIETKLKLSDEQIKEQLSVKLFSDNGLSSMIQNCFNSSPFEAINAAYPNRFKKSDLKGYKNIDL